MDIWNLTQPWEFPHFIRMMEKHFWTSLQVHTVPHSSVSAGPDEVYLLCASVPRCLSKNSTKHGTSQIGAHSIQNRARCAAIAKSRVRSWDIGQWMRLPVCRAGRRSFQSGSAPSDSFSDKQTRETLYWLAGVICL
jgi:hypothetical protein